MLRSLEEPIRHIASNSGHDGAVVAEEVKNQKGAIGFDANTGSYLDMFEAGIVDPTKVVRVAIENAVSVASVLLLTEATMTEIPEEEAKTRPGAAEMGI